VSKSKTSKSKTKPAKANLKIGIKKKVGVKKGTIKRLLAYDNPSEILAIIEPTIMLK
jgi:hypothetical protein